MSDEPYVDPFRARVRPAKTQYHGNLANFQDFQGYANLRDLIDSGYIVEVYFNGKLEDEWVVAWPEKRTMMKYTLINRKILLTAFEGSVEIFIRRS